MTQVRTHTTRREFVAGMLAAAGAGLAGLAPTAALSEDGYAGGSSLRGEPLPEEEVVAIRGATEAALRSMRLTLSLAIPIRFPLSIKAAAIGDLHPKQVAKLRALIDAGILRTAPSSREPGYISMEDARSGLEYDPETGTFRSVGRRLQSLLEANYYGGRDGCRCLVKSVPDWRGGNVPAWVERIVATRDFPEFDGPGAREDVLFFERKGGDWELTQAMTPSSSRLDELSATPHAS